MRSSIFKENNNENNNRPTIRSNTQALRNITQQILNSPPKQNAGTNLRRTILIDTYGQEDTPPSSPRRIYNQEDTPPLSPRSTFRSQGTSFRGI